MRHRSSAPKICCDGSRGNQSFSYLAFGLFAWLYRTDMPTKITMVLSHGDGPRPFKMPAPLLRQRIIQSAPRLDAQFTGIVFSKECGNRASSAIEPNNAWIGVHIVPSIGRAAKRELPE